MHFSKSGKNLTYVIAILVFAASASYVAIRFQWREAFTALLKADFLKLVVLISLSHFGYILIRAWRWRSSVRHVIPHVAFWDYYWITAVVVSLSALTPGHLGEALKIELMKRRGLLGRLPGIGAFAVERIMDVVMISSMGIIGLFFGKYATPYPGLKAGVAVAVAVGLIALCGLLCFGRGGRASRWMGKLQRDSSPKTWATMALLTVISWLLITFNWHIALSAVQIHLTPSQVLLLMSLVTIGAVLSFIPGGVDVSEMVTAAVLTNMGVAAVTAQAGALILYAYGLVVIVFGLVHLGLWLAYGTHSLSIQAAAGEHTP